MKRSGAGWGARQGRGAQEGGGQESKTERGLRHSSQQAGNCLLWASGLSHDVGLPQESGLRVTKRHWGQ